jgi:hypothetical protein
MADDDKEKKKTPVRYMPPPPWPPRPGGIQSNVSWMDTLGDFVLISGGLVGFTLAFVTFILGWSVAKEPFPFYPAITWGHVGVLLNGVSAVVFIAAAEFLTTAKQYNIWSLPAEYQKQLPNWKDIQEEAPRNMLRYEERGRFCYNLALFLMFFAFLFVIWPYNWVIAVIVFALGVGLEVFQMVAFILIRRLNIRALSDDS